MEFSSFKLGQLSNIRKINKFQLIFENIIIGCEAEIVIYKK